MQIGEGELSHIKKRYKILIMENAQLKAELQLTRRRQEGQSAHLKANIQTLDKRDEEH